MNGNGTDRAALSPWLYDLVQWAAGAKLLRRALQRRAAALGGRFALDVGGGTGWATELLPQHRFLLVDLDVQRVARFRARHPQRPAIVADGGRLPVASGVVDITLCLLMAHHLDDETLEVMLDDCARALRPGSGALFFVDPLWAPRWIPGRLLWLGDRGEHPRERGELLAAVERRFQIETAEELTVLHRYLYVLARPRTKSAAV